MTHEFWYLSRAAGFTAYLLLFASVIAGIATSTRLAMRFHLGNLPFDIHRFLSLLAVAFTLFHVYVLLGDRYIGYSVWELSVPFQSPYRPIATAAGVAAMYAMLLIVGSFYARKIIGQRTWRMLHFGTFALYALATAHGIYAGTDSGTWWARDIYLGTIAGVLLMTAYRLDHASHGHAVSGARRGAAAVAVGVAFVVSVFASASLGVGIAVTLSG